MTSKIELGLIISKVWNVLINLISWLRHLLYDKNITSNLVSVNYEVYGQVQGVFFRQNTVETATKQGCVGWVRNTHRGTVEGVVQGPKDKINFMKQWLQNVGSPFSTIDKCEFKNEKNISSLEFQRFFVK